MLTIVGSLVLLNIVTLVQGEGAPTLHLWTGKVAMTTVFILFPLLTVGVGVWYIHLVGALCILTQLESLAYIALGERNPNGRSIILAYLERRRNSKY